jgi:hypothetical protein
MEEAVRLPRLVLSPQRPGNVVGTWSGRLGDGLYPEWRPEFDELAEVTCVVEADPALSGVDIRAALDVHWIRQRMEAP